MEPRIRLRSRSVRPDDADDPRRTQARSHHRTRRPAQSGTQGRGGPSRMPDRARTRRNHQRRCGWFSPSLHGEPSPRSAGTTTSKCRASIRASGKSSFQLPARPGTRHDRLTPTQIARHPPTRCRIGSIQRVPLRFRWRGSTTKSATSPLTAWCSSMSRSEIIGSVRSAGNPYLKCGRNEFASRASLTQGSIVIVLPSTAP